MLFGLRRTCLCAEPHSQLLITPPPLPRSFTLLPTHHLPPHTCTAHTAAAVPSPAAAGWPTAPSHPPPTSNTLRPHTLRSTAVHQPARCATTSPAAMWQLPAAASHCGRPFPLSGPAAAAAPGPRAAAAAAAAAGPGPSQPSEAQSPRRKRQGPRAPRQRKQQQQQQEKDQEPEAALLIGFSPQELQLITANLHLLFPSASQPPPTAQPTAQPTTQPGQPTIIPVDRRASELAIRDVLNRHCTQLTTHTEYSPPTAAAASPSELGQAPEAAEGSVPFSSSDAGAAGGLSGQGQGPEAAEGRVVLLSGEGLKAQGAALNERLLGLGVAPAVVGCVVPGQGGTAVRDVVARIRAAHARMYELVLPLQVDANIGPPLDARVVLNLTVDAGEVPCARRPGQYRRDEGHVVVLDGMCTEAERAQILDWMTGEGHDHGGEPPAGRWEKVCVDRVGDQQTWGLRSEVLQALQDDPPPAIVAVQSRLAALYPEYCLAHMPAQQLGEGRVRRRAAAGDGGDEEGEGEEEEEEEGLSSFVGNAVMAGDPCAWHLDADPSTFPPASPWVHNFGYYYNREPGRPLFVSMLMYLNACWPEDYHAETLVLDPETQAGVFVRPAPGRMLIMDQDVPHRISAPSREADGGPRYSLVWKLVFFPRDAPGTMVPGQQEEPNGGGASSGSNSNSNSDSNSSLTAGAGVPGAAAAAGPPSLCRPEWGPPMRFGSSGLPACPAVPR